MQDKIRFVIIANPRTGTNHLIELLNSHQDIWCHREVFHKDAVYLKHGTRKCLLRQRNRNPLAFMNQLYNSSPTRACGFKIFMNHDDSVLEAVLRDRAIKKIVLYRPNILAVYSSDMIAAAENQYLIMEKTRDRIDEGANALPRTKAKAIFDQIRFENYQRAYQRYYTHVIEVLNETNQEYLFLTYEEYINEGLFRRVFPFLGLSQPAELHTRMKKMNANDILSRFVNPDDARVYLNETGKENWAQEAFMLWSRPTAGRAATCEKTTKPDDENEQLERLASNHTDSRLDINSEQLADVETLRQTLLFIDYAVPQYDVYAGSRTNFMYLALLVKMGLNVIFLPADFRRVEPYSTELNALGVETLDTDWHRNNLVDWFRKRGGEIDYVFIHKPDPAIQFLEAIKNYTKAAIIYQCHDLHFLRLQRKAVVDNDKTLLAEAKVYEKKEDIIFANSDVLLTFSEVEQQIIKEKFPQKRVVTVPLFFYEDVPTPDRDFNKRKDLLFVGACAHTPNKDAVSWFCAEILPLIRREIPDVVFNVVGANPPKEISALKSKNVRILGKVSERELQKLYENARLAVIPLRFGAGVKGKTIEAFYHGVPVVSTAIGLEGIKGIDKVMLPKDAPADFANQVVSLYNDTEQLAALSRRETEFIHEAFTVRKTAELMRDILASAKQEASARIAVSAATVDPQNITRLIAFYLPQYHPIPENDEWWGKGFTEWRNVSKAKPLFTGHYQPHIPADLGFYDLRLEEIRIAQAELAKEYGIYGFCYYHYWFNGKRLLERPLNDMLESGKPDFPFCICWANENWTRRWDGEDQQVLMKLQYNEDDDRAHIRELFRIFKDPRYIRINGKPLFLVYRTENLPNPARTARIWREEALKEGIGELYLCRVESIGRSNPRVINFDAAAEFAPDWNNKGPALKANDERFSAATAEFNIPSEVCQKNYVHYYDVMARNMMAKPMPDHTWFRCVTPAWDNTARRLEGAHIFLESTPEKYKDWLKGVIESTRSRLTGDENIVFINAWNEWAEGNHLEPDQKYGRSYLEATRQALQEESAGLQEEVFIRSPSVAPIPRLQGGSGNLPLFPEIGRMLNDRQQKVAHLEQLLAERDRVMELRDLQIADRETLIRELLGSASWRVTKPLRKAYELMFNRSS